MSTHVRAEFALIVMLFVGITGCGDGTQSQQTSDAPPPVVAVKAESRDVPDYRHYPGKTQSPSVVQIDARVKGYLEERFFEEGDDVSAGAALYLIQPDQYEAQVEQAEADVLIATSNLAFAKKEYERNEPLSTTGAISQQKWDNIARAYEDAKGKLAIAEANLIEAELNLSYCEVTSPIDGRIGQTMVDVGNLVGPGTPAGQVLAQVVQLDPMRVVFQPAAIEYAAYERAAAAGEIPVRVTAPQGGGEPLEYDGVIDLINNTAQTDTSTFLVRAVFPSTRKLVLPSQYAAVRVTLRTIKDAVLVPTDALFEDPTTHYVWFVKLDDTLERRDVKLGAEYGPFTRITSGLSTGDAVVAEGSPLLLKPGVKVQAKVIDARSFVERKSSEGASP